MPPQLLGGFEHRILLALLRLGEEDYTVPIVLEIERCTGKEVAPAAVYIGLRRLERRGLLASRMEANPAGGRARRHFRLTDAAIDQLRSSRRELSSLWDGIEARLDKR